MSPRPRGRGGDDFRNLRMNSEINVTSLIDLAFTLLIIFIITAPVLQGGLEVKLPEARVRPVTSQENPFIVTVTENGQIAIGETEIGVEEFDEVFPQLFGITTPSTVYVRIDARAVYGDLYRVLGTIAEVTQEAGSSFAMVGEPLPQNR